MMDKLDPKPSLFFVGLVIFVDDGENRTDGGGCTTKSFSPWHVAGLNHTFWQQGGGAQGEKEEVHICSSVEISNDLC